MNRKPWHQELEGLFYDEAREHIDSLGRELMAMERDPAAMSDSLPGVLRMIHNLKGSAAVVGAAEIEMLCHDWESSVTPLAGGEIAVTASLFEGLYQGLDVILAALHKAYGERPRTPAAREPAADHDPHAETRARDRGAPADSGERGSIRVSIDKVDRLMSNLEELLPVDTAQALQTERFAHLLEHAGAQDQLLGQARLLIEQALVSSQSERLLRQALGLLCEHDDRRRGATDLLRQWTMEAGQRRRELATLCGRLQDDIRDIRMVPVRTALVGVARMVRDLAGKRGKLASLRLTGGDIEGDRDVLDTVKHVIMHLVRNSIDHGIEPVEERRCAGKPAADVIEVVVTSEGSLLGIEVRDHGRGISAREVRRVAGERGIASAEELAQMSDDEARLLIFRHGFSTAREVSEISGRGVGLDAVGKAIEALGGSIALDTVEGAGTTFRLRVPVSLASAPMLTLEVGGEIYAVLSAAVDRVVRVRRADVVHVESGQAIDIAGEPTHLYRLSDILELPVAATPREVQPAVVVRTLGERTALLVDRACSHKEQVIKGLGEHLRGLGLVSGATVLADGRLAPILNIAELVRSGRRMAGTGYRPVIDQPKPQKTILVVDDSIVTRTLEKSILETAGYAVQVAAGGVEALERVQRGGIELIVCDIQMPSMDGYSLTRAIKENPARRHIPVVLVSSLGEPGDRERGLRAGADGYIVKREFEQATLLELISNLL